MNDTKTEQMPAAEVRPFGYTESVPSVGTFRIWHVIVKQNHPAFVSRDMAANKLHDAVKMTRADMIAGVTESQAATECRVLEGMRWNGNSRYLYERVA